MNAPVVKLNPKIPAACAQVWVGYATAALWSSSDSHDPTGGEYLDENYGVGDIHPDSAADHRQQCESFVSANWSALTWAVSRPGYSWEHVGQDLWLTRNGHGAGFWDRGLGSYGLRLTDAAKACGSSDPWVDKAGKVHLSM